MGELCGEAAEAKPSAAQLSRDEKAQIIKEPCLKRDGYGGHPSGFCVERYPAIWIGRRGDRN